MNKLPQEWLDELMKTILESTTNNSQNAKNNYQKPKTEENKQKESPDQILIRLATEGHNLYYDKGQNTYIEIHDVKQFQKINSYIVKIDSSDFSNWLTYEYFTNYKKVPAKQIIDGCKTVISQQARLNGQKIELFNRIATVNKEIFIDLGTQDRKMVKINKNGWEIGEYPVFFKRHKDIAELPIPVLGGEIKDLVPFLPQLPKRDVCLVLCWLIASFFSNIERAFLLLEGPQGMGKTALGKMLKDFIDPSLGGALDYNDNVAEMAQIIDHNYLPLIDNVTLISRKVSDLLCNSYSTGSFVKKKLYTDDEDFAFNLSGNAIFTTVRLQKPKGDFLDRCYKIETKKSDSSYRSKELFSAQMELQKPKIFGAIMSIVSATMRKVEEIKPNGQYRTVDFDRYAIAAAEVMGFGAEFFLKSRKYSQDIKLKSITDKTPIIEALTNYLRSNDNHYSGYMGKLLQQLPQHTNHPDELPTKPNVLSRRIGEIIPELNAAGIEAVNNGNDNYGCRWEFTLYGNGIEFEDNDSNEIDWNAEEIIESVITQGLDVANPVGTNEPDEKTEFNPFLVNEDDFQDEVNNGIQKVELCDLIKRCMK